MWIRKALKNVVAGLLLCACLLLCSSFCSAAPADEIAEPTEITLSIEQWNSLKQTIEMQDNLLSTLETLSAEDNTSLMTLMSDLNKTKQSLRKVENELISAKKSLANADKALIEQNKSFQKLSEGIKRERAINDRRQWQHTFWGVIAGIAIGATIQ